MLLSLDKGSPVRIIDKSGFSSVHETSSKNFTSQNFQTEPRKFILSPGLFSAEPSLNSSIKLDQTPKDLNNLISRFDLSISPQVENFPNTPGGKKLKKRLSDLMTTLRTKNEIAFGFDKDLSNQNEDSLLLLGNTSQPDFSGIDI